MYLLPPLFLLFTFTAIHACDQLVSARKQMKPVYAAILKDVTYQRHLSHFFAGCACANVTSSITSMRISFSECFWYCQLEDMCVAFRHEDGVGGGECWACYVRPGWNAGGVNSLTVDLDVLELDVQNQLR